ncbi:MAG: methyltransferase domain-containing protein [Bacteroidota bacterium]
MIEPRSSTSPDAVAQHYDRLDSFYRDIWGETVHHGLWVTGRETPAEAAAGLTRRVVDAVSPVGLRRPSVRGIQVCDVGCGYGAISHALAETGAEVTGLTLSEAQAEVARSRSVDGSPQFLVQDWLDNDFASASFDAVVAVESTTHMPERQRVFDELARVLKPGGRLVLCVWMASESPARWQVRHLLEPICREGRLAGLGSATENREWISRAGLVVEAEEDWSPQVARTWTVVARRVATRLVSDRRLRRFILDASEGDRVFALTVARLRLAFAVGAMRYGFFVARKQK